MLNQVQAILRIFEQPFTIQGQDFHVTGSVGISFYPQDGREIEDLIKHADMAMYQAKEEGKNTFCFYTPGMSQQSWERLAIETYLRSALDEKEFYLVYQPKQDLNTGAITGTEVLLRWENPHLGYVSPAQFVPVAEQTGLIIKIGEWVLREACKQNKQWQNAGLPPMRVAVNLSARQLLDQHLVEMIQAVLKDTGLEARWLELEITETTIMENASTVLQTLHTLKDMGIHLSIDDFGTGYSSLSYLKRFPVDTIKIDRSFIQDITEDEEARAITQAIIAMAYSLKLHVIAEGVETVDQMDLLREDRCHEIQGYILSRPLTAGQLATMLKQTVAGKSRGKRAAQGMRS